VASSLCTPARASEARPIFPAHCRQLFLPSTPIEVAALDALRVPDTGRFEEIAANWAKLRALLWKHVIYVDAEVDAQRLINANDWENALRDYPESPWYRYGREPIENFYAMTFLVRNDGAGLDLDSTALAFFHSWAMRGLPFHGFEGRRILRRFRAGEITSEERDILLKRAYEGNEAIAGFPHNRLIGEFRDNSLDDIEHRGSSYDERRNRYFSERELASLRRNPYLRVDEASIRPRPGGGYTGVVRYHAPKGIEGVVEKEINEKINRIQRLTAARRPLAETVAVIAELERNLIAIHPFLDGNGRSIRAFIDLVYQRNGLPAPLRPNEDDLVFGNAEAVEFARREMIRAVNAWIESAKKGRPKRGLPQ
jgi:hypothetical protein